MISSEVQRTLVKSPPELWAELSEATSLARHLGELGEIRIIRSEPEKRVEWEAEGASGSVLIKPSGWGTKVTLRVTREVTLPEPESVPDAEATIETTAEPTPEVSTEPTQEEPLLETAPEPALKAEAIEREAPAAAADEASLEPEPASEPQQESASEPEPRRGFFARLFGRRKPKVTPTPELTPEHSSEPTLEAPPISDQVSSPPASGSAIESLQARFQAPPAVEASPAAEAVQAAESSAAEADPPEAEAIADPPEAEAEAAPVEEASEPQVDLAAELKAAEEVAVEEVTALLTGVLDRLGAAHHRPFSRS